ncbi:MAG: hypothetical protein ACK5V3_01590 [Bdellovibrionales bacterium]
MKKRAVPNKNRALPKSFSEEISPLEAVEFLESFRIMLSEKDEPTQPISIRIPGNILRVLKTRAKLDGKKYQSLIVTYIREGLKRKSD